MEERGESYQIVPHHFSIHRLTAPNFHLKRAAIGSEKRKPKEQTNKSTCISKIVVGNFGEAPSLLGQGGREDVQFGIDGRQCRVRINCVVDTLKKKIYFKSLAIEDTFVYRFSRGSFFNEK